MNTMSIKLQEFSTDLGKFLIGDLNGKCCLMEFTDRRNIDSILEKKEALFNAKIEYTRTLLHDQIEKELVEYFRGVREHFDFELIYEGTEFQKNVWTTLLTIPYGDTWSYLDVAKKIGKPGAVRAVGAANGSNNIAIIIPCHRVINSAGNLHGYGGGLHRKKELLRIEEKASKGEYQSQILDY